MQHADSQIRKFTRLAKGCISARLALRATALVLLGMPLAGFAETRNGREFRVNTTVTSAQISPAIDADDDGDFIVVWQSYQNGDGDIFGRRYRLNGVAKGNEFRVNSYTTGNQQSPDVVSTDGRFVVVWQGQDGDGYGIFGQRYNFIGEPAGTEFPVNNYMTGAQTAPAIAADGAGNFLVTWQSAGQDGDGDGVYARPFNAVAQAQAGGFLVPIWTLGNQLEPAVAAEPNGLYLVVWSSFDQDGSNFGVFGRYYDTTGVAVDDPFQVNSYALGSQRAPAAAFDDFGRSVIVWQSQGQNGESGIFGQRFDQLLARLGFEFQVNAYTTFAQDFADVEGDGTGFIVVWQTNDGSGDLDIVGRRFAGDTTTPVPLGTEFRVNTYTTASQSGATIAADSAGEFIVAWQSANQDGDGDGVFGQRFGDVIFRNGFESGS